MRSCWAIMEVKVVGVGMRLVFYVRVHLMSVVVVVVAVFVPTYRC